MTGLFVDGTGFELLVGDERVGPRRVLGTADVELLTSLAARYVTAVEGRPDDLVDRIRNRRRAKALIDTGRELATQKVTVRLVLPGRTVELTGLTPDQLLEIADDEGEPG